MRASQNLILVGLLALAGGAFAGLLLTRTSPDARVQSNNGSRGTAAGDVGVDQRALERSSRLSKGVEAAELDRAKIGLKASIIMSGESTSGRAGAIAHDYFMRGRIRTLDEIKDAIDAVTVDRVNAYLAANKPGPFTIVIVGPKPLKLPTAV